VVRVGHGGVCSRNIVSGDKVFGWALVEQLLLPHKRLSNKDENRRQFIALRGSI
jgi:hypothetical protein